MMGRKLRWLAVPAMVAGLVLAGCAGPSTEGGSEEGYEFKYPSWMWAEGDVGEWHKDRLAEFEKAHPGVKVQATQIAASDFENQLNTQISAGEVPDLMPAFTNQMPYLMQNNLLAPLDECFADSDVMDRILPSVKVVQKDGKTYGAPLTMSPNGLLYNMDLMEQAGVTEVPSTPEELLEASRLVKEKTGKFGYAFETDTSDVLQTYIKSMIWMLGYGSDWSKEDGTIIADDPKNVEALEMLMTFYDEELTPKGLEATAVRTMFAEGGAAFVTEGPWVMTQVQSDNPDLYPRIGFAPSPTPTHAALSGGAFWAIPAASKNYDDACEYLKINLQPEPQRLWLEELTQIPGTSVQPSAEFLALNPWVETMVEVAVKYPGGLGYAPPGYQLQAAEFRQVAVDSLSKVFAGSATVAEALSEAQSTLTAEFGGK